MKSPHVFVAGAISSIALSAVALAQTSYPDATGEVAVGSFPHLDITSVEVAADAGTNQITFTIFVEGNPTNPDWGRYMIALKSGSGGTTGRLTGPGVSGETTGRPITFPSGMTHWIGTWNSGGAIWTYDSAWTRSGTVVPVKDGTSNSITIVAPFSALALSAGETFTFDVFSSGGGGSDSAVDALSLSNSSITAWSGAFAAAQPVSFTMPSAADSDGDGLPDAWETTHFASLSQGAAGDPDGDLLQNAGEFSRSTNPTKPDTDSDGLSDKVEDNGGVYAGPTAPGTNPLLSDSDNDGHLDGAEASGTTTLLYESNPLRKNFAVFAVPGDFNSWDPAGLATPTNAMTAAGTSLTEQYQWRLDYHFTGSGRDILYKYAGGSWSDNWGAGSGIGVASGDNIDNTIIASGIHRFTFDQVTLAYTFTRPTFADVAAYLFAYQLEAEPLADSDGDGLTNSAEFAGNTDPTNLDTDGDAVADGLDSDPLVPATAYDLWIATTGVPAADRARTADPDADGLTNHQEFFFGGNPASGAQVPIVFSLSETDSTMQWIGRTAPTEATYAIETTTTLQPGWTTVAAVAEAASDQSGVPAGYTRWQMTVPRPGATDYLRIRGTEL